VKEWQISSNKLEGVGLCPFSTDDAFLTSEAGFETMPVDVPIGDVCARS
jgi:hypothetical protein